MPDLSTLTLFISASLILVVVPGPTIALIICKSIAEGKRIALPLVAGVAMGGLVAASLALMGASTVLMGSAMAFVLMKWCGAIYLIFLGIKMLRARPETFDLMVQAPTGSRRRAFKDGFMVMVFNPKGILFFAAFVPQFIRPDLNYASQAAVFVLLFVVVGMIVDTAYVFGANAIRDIFNGASFQRRVNKVAGVTIIGAGIMTLLAKRPQV